MYKVLVVRAIGEGGYAEPETSTYISSKIDTAAPDTTFVRILIDQGKVELVEELGEDSSWADYTAELQRTPRFDGPEALENYKKNQGELAKEREKEAAKAQKAAKAQAEADEAARKAAEAAAKVDNK